MDTQQVKDYLLTLQQNIVATLENMDGGTFRMDRWSRPEGGGGITRVIENGNLLERGGVNFSHVMGKTLPPSASAHRPELSGAHYEAMGVSLVLHPRNPYVPTVHMNVRFFRAFHPEGANPLETFWFGGGMDLTPYYGFAEDAVHFHQTCQKALATHSPDLYPQFKAWCDRYFYLKHRQEPRGIGGIFFDDYKQNGFAAAFAMLQDVGNAFLPAYLPIVERRRAQEYAELQRQWQAFRRSRYVEFNLVYDRGTLFGLQSGGRTESILVSMPPVASWIYDFHPQPDSPEGRLLCDFLCEKDWLNIL